MHRYGYAGLLPKAFSPTHYLKKAGLMPKGKKAPAEPIVSEPAPAVSTNPQGQLMVLALGAGLLVVALMGGRR